MSYWIDFGLVVSTLGLAWATYEILKERKDATK